MDILNPRAALAALALTACYEPRLPSCTVACSSELDCSPGQACGDEGYCVGPDLACSPRERPDTPTVQPDAPAPVQMQIHIKIDDQGTVVVRDIGECDSDAPQNGDCTFTTTWPQVTLIALPHLGRRFETWLSGCTNTNTNTNPTCSLSLSTQRTEARARFHGL